MADKYGRPSVSSLIEFLSKFPPDSIWWAYEGEVSGVIISHANLSGIAHNDGTCEGPKTYEVPKDEDEDECQCGHMRKDHEDGVRECDITDCLFQCCEFSLMHK